MRNGRLDVCLLHPPRNLEPTLNVELAWRESLVVALPREHALAAKQRINIRSLAAEPWFSGREKSRLAYTMR